MPTVRAALSMSTAPKASTRSEGRAISVVGSIAVTGVLWVELVVTHHIWFPTGFLRPRDTVRVRVTRRCSTLTNSRKIGVGGAGASQQFLHVLRGLGHLVQHERQRRGEAHTGGRANPGPQRALGPLERRRGARIVRVVLQRLAAHRVEQRRVVQVSRHLRVRDGHEGQRGILDLELDRRRDDRADAFRELARPPSIDHYIQLSWRKRLIYVRSFSTSSYASMTSPSLMSL